MSGKRSSRSLSRMTIGKYMVVFPPRPVTIMAGGSTKNFLKKRKIANIRQSGCGIRKRPRLFVSSAKIRQASSPKKVSPRQRSVHYCTTSPACSEMPMVVLVLVPRARWVWRRLYTKSIRS